VSFDHFGVKAAQGKTIHYARKALQDQGKRRILSAPFDHTGHLVTGSGRLITTIFCGYNIVDSQETFCNTFFEKPHAPCGVTAREAVPVFPPRRLSPLKSFNH